MRVVAAGTVMAVMLTGGPAVAQEAGDVGITMGYPVAVGVVWHITDAIVALGLERPPARLLARMTLNLLIGAQQREHPVDLKRLRQTFEEFQKLIFLEADPKLVARLARATG